jgi:hypothetical protein
MTEWYRFMPGNKALRRQVETGGGVSGSKV